MGARMRWWRDSARRALTSAVIAGCVIAAGAAIARAQTGEESGMEIVPETSATPRATPRPARHRKPTAATPEAEPEVEPAQARLRLMEDTWAYTRPAKSSKRIERVHKDKFVRVTGSTRYYVQVKLKSGKVGYVLQSAVDLVKPIDKLFTLTADASVRDQPNRWAKKVAEVHKGHAVHAIGIALSYMKIRMKSGLEGYIPISALQ